MPPTMRYPADRRLQALAGEGARAIQIKKGAPACAHPRRLLNNNQSLSAIPKARRRALPSTESRCLHRLP